MKHNKNRWRVCFAVGLSGALILTGAEPSTKQVLAQTFADTQKAGQPLLKKHFVTQGLHKITIPDDYYDEVITDDSDLALDDDIGEDNPTWEDFEQELQDQQKQENEEINDNNGATEETDVPEKGYYFLDTAAAYIVSVSDSENGEVRYRAPLDGTARVVIPAEVIISEIEFKVTSIASQAFKNNKKVVQVSGGSQITAVGKEAFSGCKKLKKVTLGSKVKSIGKKAFSGCDKLKNLTIKTKKLNGSNVGTGAFKGIPQNAVVKVPKSKIKTYTTLFQKKGLNKKVKLKAI